MLWTVYVKSFCASFVHFMDELDMSACALWMSARLMSESK